MNPIIRIAKKIAPASSWILKTIGILVLVAGLQAWGFYRNITPQIGKANQYLLLLQEEERGNHLLNTSLNALRDYRRISTDKMRQQQILQLREAVVRQFRGNPRLAIEEFVSVASGFEAQSTVEQELLTALQEDLSLLGEIYSDHFAAVTAQHTKPAWYFQPVASLVTMNSSGGYRLDFDHALYLMLVGERGAANAIYGDLRQEVSSDAFKSRILFAQSRLQYDAFRNEPDPEYHRQAVQYAQQSLRHDAVYELPKLFLDYLLAIDLQAVEVESTPMEGQGSGEAQGERGAISTDLPEH